MGSLSIPFFKVISLILFSPISKILILIQLTSGEMTGIASMEIRGCNADLSPSRFPRFPYRYHESVGGFGTKLHPRYRAIFLLGRGDELQT